MSIRSKWCEFNQDERKYMKKRDNEECVICHKRGALEAMHVFLSRAKGGRGIRTNGAMGCCKCHKIMDNPIGQAEVELSKKYMDHCKKYLIEKENITYNKEFIETLKYHKQIPDLNSVSPIKPEPFIKRCKNCQCLVKNKYNNSTIPSYYCKYKKILLNKNTKACDNHREVVR